VEAKFFITVQSDPGGTPSFLYNGYLLSLLGGGGANRHGLGVTHPPPYTTEIIEMVELYLYSPL